MKRVFLLSAGLIAFVSASAEMRMWTNITGQIIEAEMTGVNAVKRSVQIRLKNGSIAEIPIESLSPPDKEYARQHWAQTTGGAPAASTTAVDVKKLPPRYASRFSADARLAKLLESGLTADAEASVIRSLDGFKAKQNADGSWGRGNKCAMTGFALQCFLGHGETPDSEAYGDSIMRGLMFLIETAKKNPHGMLAETWEGGKSGAGTYEHAIATDALGQAYTLARLGSKSLPGLREAYEKAIALIISHQTPEGSWSYGGRDIAYNPQKGKDLSLANWHFLALHTAQDCGLKIQRLESAMKKASSYIQDMQTKDGGFGASSREFHYNQWSLSGGATAGLMLLEDSSAAQAQKGIRFIHNYLTAEPPEWDQSCNLYCWYGYTNALHQAGGAEWLSYAKKVFPQVIAAQEPDGRFKSGRPNYPAGDATDPTYRQALCTLILETPYRMAK